jgi:rod shape-determining protein MreB
MDSRTAYRAIEEHLDVIIAGVKDVLERTPPELAVDVLDKGVVLTGGGSMIHGLPERLSMETGLAVILAEDPISCVARGTGKLLAR